MKHTITITIKPIREEFNQEDSLVPGTYIISFDDADNHDLGSKAVDILMHNVPISFPEDFDFFVSDEYGSDLEDHGNRYPELCGTVRIYKAK